MRKIRAFCATVILALGGLAAAMPAQARDAFMTVGVATTQPIGHHLFCIERSHECAPDHSKVPAGPVDLRPDLIARIAELNTRTNARIRPKSDLELYGVEERWSYPDEAGNAGDCEDYVLLKRRLLADSGIALSNLLITVVRKRNGTGHAVLTLRTNHGDFILDNLDWRVRAWNETPYTYLKRQSVSDAGRWITIEDEADVLVGALAK